MERRPPGGTYDHDFQGAVMPIHTSSGQCKRSNLGDLRAS